MHIKQCRNWVFYCKFYVYWHWNVNHAAEFKLLTFKYRSRWSCCNALWWYKSMLCSASKQLHSYLKSQRAISLTTGLRRKQKCTARPGRRPRCGGWQKSMWNSALTWMHLACGDRWEKTWPTKVELACLGAHSKIVQALWLSFCKISNYTEWWWCVKVQSAHCMT